MRTFAQKPQPSHETKLALPVRHGMAIFGKSNEANAILHFQRTIGNQAVQGLIQGNVEDHEPGSKATALTQFRHDFSKIPFQPKTQTKDMKGLTPARSIGLTAATPSADVPSSVYRVLAGRGASLPHPMRQRAESFFGADLGHVRIHTGDSAARANLDINARAFSVGSDIVLHDHTDLSDRRLIAHELTHVLQPPASSQVRPISSPGDPAEHEAEAAAERFPDTIVSRDSAPALNRVYRSAVVHCDQRHPSATVFDADYLLYALDGTAYDNATQRYYLSPWDRTHLMRVNGLYILEAPDETYLITPPEIRRAAGASRGVLVELTSTEIAALFAAGGAGAAQFAIDLAQRRLRVTVSSVTLSNGASQDFTRPALPAGVSSALSSPLEMVSSSQAAGVEAARTRAASAQQERTLSLASGEELPLREIGWSDEMDVNTLFNRRDDASRADWYVGRLAAFQAQLLESAQSHQLPMQLLAAVILNELADINWADVIQSGPSTFHGSLGIAQIQVDTARRDRLVDLPAGSHHTGWARSDRHAHDIDHPTMVDMGERLRIGQLLQVPQVAIEAAAREIEQLLTRMGANRGRPWQIDHDFNATGPQGNAIYSQVGAGGMMNREATLADAVCGAYNSPDVITASNTSTFSNARIHGQNANHLARDLYRFRLFRTT